MSEEELQEQIITQIEVLVEELGGIVSHLTKCDYTGKSSNVAFIIEYMYAKVAPATAAKQRK